MQIANNNLAKAEHITTDLPENSGNKETHPKKPIEEFNHKQETLSQEDINKLSNGEQAQTDTEDKSKSQLRNFFENTLVKYTTGSSAIINLLSSPIRLFDDNNPLKKIINKISMAFTRGHLGAYSIAGLLSAFEQKNPFLVFSFLVEGITAMMSLRKIYLFRGIATGVDGAVAGIKDKYKKSNFKSYGDAWNHSIQAIKDSFKAIVAKCKDNPLNIFKLDGNDIAIFSSLTAALGGAFGMTIDEKSGSIVRDIAGGLGDFGIFKLDNPTAKSSGFFYLGGTILDLAARIFNKSIASVLGIKEVSHFERLRDAFHEAAIAFDRVGQYFFLKYTQKDEKKLKVQKREDHEGYLVDLAKEAQQKQEIHQAQTNNTALAA